MDHDRSHPYFLSEGFRPFFFLGAIAIAASVLLWAPYLTGAIAIPTAFVPRDWHVHTMLFGGVLSIVAGFALTAASRWTGRPPVAGPALAALVALWAAGRVAVSCSALIGPVAACVIDLLFPLALAAVLSWEVASARDVRNYRIVVIIGLFALADLGFHIEAGLAGSVAYALRGSVAVVILLVMAIGGRMIPAFTENWLHARNSLVHTRLFSTSDQIALAVSAAALANWILAPGSTGSGILMIAAGLANGLRQARWAGGRTGAEPLLWSLHAGYAALVLGFLMVGASSFAPSLDQAAAVHIWTAGAVGVLTLAVMTRVSRAHSGRELHAGTLEIVIYALAMAGAAARVLAPFAGNMTMPALEIASLAWAGAYLVFAAGYARMLLFQPCSSARASAAAS